LKLARNARISHNYSPLQSSKTIKNSTFNGIKPYALDHILRLLVLLEENGVTFEYLQGKRNVAAIVDT
jgi:hypothetical protein